MHQPASLPLGGLQGSGQGLYVVLADDCFVVASEPYGVVEETMRYLGTVRATMRIASEDIVLHDVELPAGTLVMTSLAAANRDGGVWEDPHRFDIDRPATTDPQLTFGSGVHYCLGAALARAELQEALPILARRMPDLAVDGTIEWKPPTVGIWGPAALPLRFGAGQQ